MGHRPCSSAESCPESGTLPLSGPFLLPATGAAHWSCYHARPPPCCQALIFPFLDLPLLVCKTPKPSVPTVVTIFHQEQFNCLFFSLPAHPDLSASGALLKGDLALSWQVPWGSLLSTLFFCFCILLTTRYRERP